MTTSIVGNLKQHHKNIKRVLKIPPEFNTFSGNSGAFSAREEGGGDGLHYKEGAYKSEILYL